ncbi:hypothetical protein GCM10022393_10100 [Aquimarina addita]|uniref:PDZ domain-containing protein n=1 Tax=Aquimarina addita TaxID=870485 RepID=A0ABP7XCY5_9FLAO
MCYTQKGFEFQEKIRKDRFKFTLVNNLIIIPVTLNGLELSFILDTGVGGTILFSLDKKESLELNNVSKIFIRGFGNDDPVEAIKSTNNRLSIGNAISSNHTVYMVFDDSINFSSQMGFPVHGIIGYDFFKDFVVDINYTKKLIKIHDPETYTYKPCKKCYDTGLDLTHGRKRPLIQMRCKTNEGITDVNLLLDSGSGSALWLFENKKRGIHIPKKSFDDFLGKGFNGDIYGKKTKIDRFYIGDFELKEVTTSFPDSLYTNGVYLHNRHGSIGGSLLKRFNLIIDYPNSKISFRKNSGFSKPFYYNMSGLTIEHSGVRVLKDYNIRKATSRPSLEFLNKEEGKIIKEVLKADVGGFIYALHPTYKVSDVRPDSPADIAGLKEDDEILEINGKASHHYTLSAINDLFYSEAGKRIKIKVQRLGVIINYTFRLKKVI